MPDLCADQKSFEFLPIESDIIVWFRLIRFKPGRDIIIRGGFARHGPELGPRPIIVRKLLLGHEPPVVAK